MTPLLLLLFSAIPIANAQQEERNERQVRWESCVHTSFRKHWTGIADKAVAVESAFQFCLKEEDEFWNDPSNVGLPRGLIANLKSAMKKEMLESK